MRHTTLPMEDDAVPTVLDFGSSCTKVGKASSDADASPIELSSVTFQMAGRLG